MWGGFFYPLMFILPVIAILVGIQNHLSATILIIMITSIMMLMAGSKLKYFLTSGGYLTLDNRTTARMEGIININEKLYIYHLLENEQFDKLNGKNIDEQLELFDNPIIICELDANKVNEFDVTLNKIGITTSETNYDKLMKKSKECEKVLQKLKK